MTTDPTETAIINSRRALATTQALFPSMLTNQPVNLSVGWIGSDQLSETGIVAVTSLDDRVTPLVGEYLLLRNGTRQVVVYVIGRRDVGVDLALSRRAFIVLAGLWVEQLNLVARIVR